MREMALAVYAFGFNLAAYLSTYRDEQSEYT